MFRPLFLFILTGFLAGAVQAESLQQALAIADQQKISEIPQWRKLLHFEKDFFRNLVTQIDSPSFFLAPDGGENLHSELQATLKAFWEAPMAPEESVAQCRYPGRFRFLKAHLKDFVHEWPDRNCPRFEKYLNALKGDSLSLVFSSFYLNNPSSAFGHTFMRINKKANAEGKRFELLDYGINYAAEVDTGNAAIYAFKGLFGFFPGKFTSVPYYFKVREYNNSESRDLWEYDLNVGPADVEMYIAHVWELGPAKIDYWYLTENCSYHMLTTLEAAAPQVDVVPYLKKWIIPSDTVKDVWNRPGLVKSFHYRPSVRTEFYQRLKLLADEEQVILQEMVEQRKLPANFEKREIHSRLKILDTAIDYMDYKFVHEVLAPGPEADFKDLLLKQRSQIDIVTEPLVIPTPDRELPHLGHGSRRLNLGFRGSDAGADATLFGLKYALHDQTDIVTGYPEYASIDFGDFQFSYLREKQKLDLENFSLFEVISFSPLNRFSKAFSWRIKIGAEKLDDENCLGCHGAVISGGAGYTVNLSEAPLLSLFAGVRGAQYYIPSGDGRGFLAGAGPSAQLRMRWTDRLISLAEGWYRYEINQKVDHHQRYDFSTQYAFDRSWAVKASGTDLQYERRAQLELFYIY